MNSANVTNLPLVGDLAKAPAKQGTKSDEQTAGALDFKSLMSKQVADGGTAPSRNASANGRSVEQLAGEPKQSSFNNSAKQDNYIAKDPNGKRTEASASADKIENLCGQAEEKIETVVSDALDVTDEQIEEAMEVLGLSFSDLLNPQNMQALITQMTDETGASGLDMLAITPEELTDMLTSAIEPMLEEASLSTQEAGMLLNEFVPTEDAVVTDRFMQMLTDAGVDAETLSVTGNDAAFGLTVDEEVPTEFVMTRPLRTEDAGVRIIDVADEPVIVTEDMPEEIAPLQAEGNTQAEDGATEDETAGGNRSSDFVRQTAQLSDDTADVLPETATNISQPQPTFAENIAAAQQATPEAYTTVDTADVIEQIVSNATTTITEEVTRMEIELNPQTLGRMLMQVQQSNDGVVTARLVTQNEAVREALEAQMNILRENLTQRGIRVDAVEVSVGAHEFERNLEEGQQSGQFEEQQREGQPGGGSRRNLDRAGLDDLQGLMTEEEELAARIMRDEGNTLNYQA